MCYDLLISMGYIVKEKSYEQKEGDSKFIDIHWEAEKKVDDFTKFTLKIRFFLTSWKPKQKIQKNGVMIITDIGDPEISISAVLTRDYDGKWDRNPFLKMFLNFYNRYIYKKTYKNWQDKIVEEASDFINELKSYFNMV